MTQNPQPHHLPHEWGPAQRVFGGPLQEKVRRLMKHPQAPSWARLVRDLDEPLKRLGLAYHPRTLKRQLNGKISYVPAGLERAFEEWLEGHRERLGKSWVKDIQSTQTQESAEDDPLLYVPVQNFQNLAKKYLAGHPGLSRRKLALLLQKKLADQNFSVGMEAIQSAVAGKTQRVRHIYEQVLTEMVAEMPEKPGQESAGQSLEYGDAASVPQVVDEILAQNPGFSRRKIAGLLKQELNAHKISMSLNSLQVILSGKTRKTRHLILELLDSWKHPESLREAVHRYGHSLPKRGRRNLEVDVAAAWQNWHQAVGSDKTQLRHSFLELRQALLRERWLERQRKHRSSGKSRRHRNSSQNPLLPPDEEAMDNSGFSEPDLDFGRLVS